MSVLFPLILNEHIVNIFIVVFMYKYLYWKVLFVWGIGFLILENKSNKICWQIILLKAIAISVKTCYPVVLQPSFMHTPSLPSSLFSRRLSLRSSLFQTFLFDQTDPFSAVFLFLHLVCTWHVLQLIDKSTGYIVSLFSITYQ